VTTLIALSPLPPTAFDHLRFSYVLCGMLRPVALASYALAAHSTLVDWYSASDL
jgi:hypothetical protein